MKKQYILSVFISFYFGLSFAQSQFTQDFVAVRTELVSWDAVRGDWLANSFEAMVSKQEIPQRTFPEDLTPNELYRLVPEENKKSIRSIVTTNEERASEKVQKDAWRKIAVFTQTNSCKPVSARSYGDPHLNSFDGASFSFQTVGEFIMSKSTSGHMEVQTRQTAQSDDFSLNTAVAMNVSGDRVCFYANEKPDSDQSPIRLNGNPIQINEKTYHLPHGGTIVKNGKNDYIVNWPTGENVNLDFRRGGKMDFINVAIEIIPCLNETYNGVLGNANRDISDDFKTKTGRDPQANFVRYVSFGGPDSDRVAKQVEKEHLAYLAKDFANDWRVTIENSLFDYGFGLNTFSYTDFSFPRVHRTLDDLSTDQRNTAKKSCEDAGFTGFELRSCIYDRGFLNIPTAPKPVVRDRTEGVVLAKVERPISEPKNPETRRTFEEKPQNEITKKEIEEGRGGNSPAPISKEPETRSEKSREPQSTSTPWEKKEPAPKVETRTSTVKKDPVIIPKPIIISTPTKTSEPTRTSSPTPIKTKTTISSPTPTPSRNPIKTRKGGM